jgi:hypothetical protein
MNLRAGRWELFEPDENVEKLPKGLAPYASPMQTAVPWLITSWGACGCENSQCFTLLKRLVSKSKSNLH